MIFGGLNIIKDKPFTDQENSVAILLLDYAKRNPDLAEQHRTIRCSELGFPKRTVEALTGTPIDSEFAQLPPKIFTRVVEKLMSATLECKLWDNNGWQISMTAAYLPVTLIDDETDPMVMFCDKTQCYFVLEEQNGEEVFQMKPLNDMREFMLEYARKGRVK